MPAVADMQQSIIQVFENNPNVVTVLYNEGGSNGETKPWLQEVWSNFDLQGDIIFDATGENSRMNYFQDDTGLPFGRAFIIDQTGRVVLPYFSHQPDLAVETINNLLAEPPITRQWKAKLSGREVVPRVSTQARGVADLVQEGDAVHYTLRLSNIQDIHSFHVHCAPRGQNGPIGVTLDDLSDAPAGYRPEGVIFEGFFTQPDPANGCGWESLADVTDAFNAGLAYINVHTSAYPDGEIRGQLMPLP